MDRRSNSWSEGRLTNLAFDTWYEPGLDPASDRILLQQGYMENDQLLMNVTVVHLAHDGKAQIEADRKWNTDKRTLFGATGTNVRLNEPGRRRWPSLGPSVINGSEVFVPYCLDGETTSGPAVSHGPFNNGVFHSGDLGATWQVECISSFEAFDPSMCRTKDHYYYFATKMAMSRGFDLWFSRKRVEGGAWDTPNSLTKTFPSAYGRYVAVATDDTVHVCWLDRRHEKSRLNLQAPYRQNYEVAYCHRKDSDTSWSKDIILSKGLYYSYAPSMSVEGKKIVVAWAGISTAKDWHSANDPNDIYYVTSNDGGRTWAKLLKVTNGSKDGITSGEPQVVLLNGSIYLFYIQGKMNLKQESPGLTKLNQPPWPIYYQQRPFPN